MPAYLGHHAAPSNDLRVDLFALLFLVSHDSPQEAIEVLIDRVIMLVEGLKALR